MSEPVSVWKVPCKYCHRHNDIRREDAMRVFMAETRLLDAATKTLRDNLDLCDGDNCTLKDLRDAVAAIDPNWEKTS